MAESHGGSHGESGAIQITCNTYDLVKDQFECESRGTIKVKGTDAMEVWHVIGRKGRSKKSTPDSADIPR